MEEHCILSVLSCGHHTSTGTGSCFHAVFWIVAIKNCDSLNILSSCDSLTEILRKVLLSLWQMELMSSEYWRTTTIATHTAVTTTAVQTVDAVRILEKTPHCCAHITPLRHQSGFHVTANEHLSLFNGRTSNWYFYCSVKFSLGYSKITEMINGQHVWFQQYFYKSKSKCFN